MNIEEMKEIASSIGSGTASVAKGQVEYRLVAFDASSRFPIILITKDAFDVPSVDEEFEVRVTGRTINGTVKYKDVVFQHNPNLLAIVTTVLVGT